VRAFLLDDYLIDCEVRGLTSVTIKGYKTQLTYYLNHYELSQEGVNKFILDSREMGRHTATINSYLIAIRAFSNYANVCINIHLLKKEEVVKDIYTTDEIKKLVKKPVTKNFNELKTWCLVCFLVGTGCRIGTALDIRVEDVDFGSGYVTFRHMKNKKQQVYPLSRALIGVLKQYLVVRGNDGYLFCNQYGDKADMRTTQKQIADYNKARGVNKTSAHLFRHTFAVNFLRNNGDIYTLSRLLNHSSLEMSAHYASAYGTNMNIKMEELSPLDTCIKQKIRI